MAGGPLVLAAFRMWRRRQRDAWPTIALSRADRGHRLWRSHPSGYVGVLGMALHVPLRLRIASVGYALVAVAATGFVVAVGAMQLLVIAAIAEIRGRRAAA